MTLFTHKYDVNINKMLINACSTRMHGQNQDICNISINIYVECLNCQIHASIGCLKSSFYCDLLIGIVFITFYNSISPYILSPSTKYEIQLKAVATVAMSECVNNRNCKFFFLYFFIFHSKHRQLSSNYGNSSNKRESSYEL